jgi:hypothetical protein
VSGVLTRHDVSISSTGLFTGEQRCMCKHTGVWGLWFVVLHGCASVWVECHIRGMMHGHMGADLQSYLQVCVEQWLACLLHAGHSRVLQASPCWV